MAELDVLSTMDPTDAANFVKYAKRSLEQEEEFHFLRFEFLQRLNLTKLQVDLIRTKSRVQRNECASNEELKELKVQLEDYSMPARFPPPVLPTYLPYALNRQAPFPHVPRF